MRCEYAYKCKYECKCKYKYTSPGKTIGIRSMFSQPSLIPSATEYKYKYIYEQQATSRSLSTSKGTSNKYRCPYRVLAGIFNPEDLTELPTPPTDPIVPPWGGHPPPPRMKESAAPAPASAPS